MCLLQSCMDVHVRGNIFHVRRFAGLLHVGVVPIVSIGAQIRRGSQNGSELREEVLLVQ
jgi:hypothetical protein